LHRYRLGDCVRVVGWVGQCPCIRFTGRAHVSDLYGEKLSENQVARAIAVASESAGVAQGFALLAPDGPGARRYALYLACETAPQPEQIVDLAITLDVVLSENPHYAYCRTLGQINAAVVVLLPGSPARAHARYMEALRSQGSRAGGIKPAALSREADWAAHLGAQALDS
jgi:hypothetical protein